MPVPEVFGWAEDANQIFLYMQFIEGETLMARWGSLDEDERRAICKELCGYLKMIRSLEQDLYIGEL